MNVEGYARVRAVFDEQEIKNKCTDANAISAALVGEVHPLYLPVQKAIQRMDTRTYAYEGAHDTMRDLLSTGDSVLIWTQGHELGQLWKVARAGFGDLRRDLPPDERQRFSVYRAMDKIRQLPELIHAAIGDENRQVVVVDDKSVNILAIDESIRVGKAQHRLRTDARVLPVWINQGRTKDVVPPDYKIDEDDRLEKFQQDFRTITDIRMLGEVRKELVENGVNGNIAWFIDFDHTLVNTAEAQKNALRNVTTLLYGLQSEDEV